MELNKIYNMDCLEGMKEIADKSIKLIIADPPYGINYQSNFKQSKFSKIHNDKTFLSDWIVEAKRVLSDDGAIYLYTRWDVFDKWLCEIKKHFKVKNVIVWYKKGGGLGDLKGSYMFNHEFIIYAVNGKHLLNGKRTNDVWEISKGDTSKYIHPTQKPIELAENIIRKSTNECDNVLIPFVGSGNDVIASLNTRRFFIGFELDKNYFDIANKRIQESVVGW